MPKVNALPTITLSPASGPTGIEVIVNGTFFNGVNENDQSCSISSVAPDGTAIPGGTPGGIVQASACKVNLQPQSGANGPGTIAGSFFVGPVSVGQYTIEVTGCPGNNGCAPSIGDFAQGVFTVTSGPAIRLSPATGAPGTHVLVNGTGFSLVDINCAVAAPGSGAILPGTQACVIRTGTGLVNASFTIGNVLPGQYIIQVQGSGGEHRASDIECCEWAEDRSESCYRRAGYACSREWYWVPTCGFQLCCCGAWFRCNPAWYSGVCDSAGCWVG